MNFISRFFATIFALLFIVLLPFSLLSFNLGQALFNRTLLKTTIIETITQSQLIPRALAWFTDELSPGLPLADAIQDDLRAVMLSLTDEGWQDIREEVITDDILAGWVSSGVEGFFGWLESDDPMPMISVNMETFKARLESDSGLRAIDVAYDALPTCDEAEVEAFKTTLRNAPAGTNVYYPPCQLPDPYHDDQLTDYLNSLEEMVEAIPATYDFPGENATQNVQAWQSVKDYLRIFQSFYWLGLVVSILLVGFVIYLRGRNPRSLARWGGLPLSLAGIGAILLSWVPGPVINVYLVRGPIKDVSQPVQDEVLAVVSRILGEVFTPMMIEGLVVLLLGGLTIVIVGGMISKQPPKRIQKNHEEAKS